MKIKFHDKALHRLKRMHEKSNKRYGPRPKIKPFTAARINKVSARRLKIIMTNHLHTTMFNQLRAAKHSITFDDKGTAQIKVTLEAAIEEISFLLKVE